MKINLFPFKKIRKEQDKFLEDCSTTIKNGGRLVASVPTGVGKTAAALTSALEYSLENDKLVVFLTCKQSQHFIAIETLKAMNKKRHIVVSDIIAKKDMCPRKDKPDFGFQEFCSSEIKRNRCKFFYRSDKELAGKLSERILHVEELCRICEGLKCCPHKVAFELARISNVLICDYNYLFSDLCDGVLGRLHRSLEEIMIIVDEAHNLTDRIRNNYYGALSIRDVEMTIKELSKFKRAKELKPYLESIHEYLLELDSKYTSDGEMEVGRDELIKSIGAIRTLSQISEEEVIEKLAIFGNEILEKGAFRSSALELSDFLLDWSKDRGDMLYIYNGKLRYMMLDVSKFSKKIFDRVHSAILMSGTLYPMQMFADILGIEGAVLKSYSSPFPKENSRLLCLTDVTTRYNSRSPESYARMGRILNKMSMTVDGNLAIFFPSYKLMDSIGSGINAKPLIREYREMSKTEKDKIYRRLEMGKQRGGAILLGVMGGSLSEGIDYYNNLLSAIFITGLPLAPPNLEVKSLIDFYARKFGMGREYGYIFPAMNKVLQASGRAIRSENDRAITVLLDYRYLYRDYARCFPAYMKPIPVESDHAPAFIQSFFTP